MSELSVAIVCLTVFCVTCIVCASWVQRGRR
jgi:hypothetical protein